MSWSWYGNTFDEVQDKYSCRDCEHKSECDSYTDKEHCVCGDFTLDES